MIIDFPPVTNVEDKRKIKKIEKQQEKNKKNIIDLCEQGKIPLGQEVSIDYILNRLAIHKDKLKTITVLCEWEDPHSPNPEEAPGMYTVSWSNKSIDQMCYEAMKFHKLIDEFIT